MYKEIDVKENVREDASRTNGKVYKLSRDVQADNGVFKAGSFVLVENVKFVNVYTVFELIDYETGDTDTLTLASASAYGFMSALMDTEDTIRVNNRMQIMKKSSAHANMYANIVNNVWVAAIVLEIVALILSVILYDVNEDLFSTIGALSIIMIIVTVVTGNIADIISDIWNYNIFFGKKSKEIEIK